MPLRRGKKYIGSNIEKMKKEGYPRKRAVAAGLNAAIGGKSESNRPKPIGKMPKTTMNKMGTMRKRRGKLK